MPKTVTLRLDDKTYVCFLKMAKAQSRPLANFIEPSVKEHIWVQEFADDAEVAEILANEQLVRRLKKGSKEARQKKGMMIG